MSNLNDPDITLKQTRSFKRQNLRPWDDPINFIPTKFFNEIKNNEESTSTKPISKPIGKQLVNPLVNNKGTISKPIGKQKETISKQPIGSLVNNKETIGKRISKPISKQFINQNPPVLETQKISYEQSFKAIKRLCGLQKKALFYIVEDCKTEGMLHTGPITNEFFRNLLNTDVHSVKTTIHRLVKKGLISRKDGKKGNGGYSIFSITETIRNIVFEIIRQIDLYNKLSFNLESSQETIDSPIGKQLVNPLVNNAPVVVSSYINTTTYLPEDFKQIDCSALIGFGFEESHIIQIYREYLKKPELSLSAEIVQNSINALAFDLKHNNVAESFKQSPTVVLTALLKKGQPYSSKTPEKVLAPREEAMREYLVAQQKRNAKILEIENQAKDCALQEWLANLSNEELLAFNQNSDQRPEGMPEKLFEISRRKKALVTAKEYFDTVIWPSKCKQFLDQDES